MSAVPPIFNYLKTMAEMEGSDLYLTVGYPPSLRLQAGLHFLDPGPMTPDDLQDVINAILTGRQRREYEEHMELNASLDMGPHGRFRINVLKQKQHPALVIRRIVSKIPTMADLRLPKALENLALVKRGLILVTGMTGSGKSTTLASMVDYRNNREQGHIITIEDPIEYFHEHKRSVVTQREVGVDTESFSTALKNALRQRPDVILVGEIRDSEVMEHALTAAETGHLCLATLHTTNAYQAIERIVNMFPEDYHQHLRLNLSMNLKAIIAQRLVPAIGGGMTVAVEVMINEGLVKELIFKGQISKIKEIMEQNATVGMCTFDQCLLNLYKEGRITEETALIQADQSADMKLKIQQAKLGKGEDTFRNMDLSRLSISD